MQKPASDTHSNAFSIHSNLNLNPCQQDTPVLEKIQLSQEMPRHTPHATPTPADHPDLKIFGDMRACFRVGTTSSTAQGGGGSFRIGNL